MIIEYLKHLKYRFAVKKNSSAYLRQYIRRWKEYSATELRPQSNKYLKLRILIEAHTIEKGLSHNDFRPGFGKDVVIKLVNNLKEYECRKEADSFCVRTGYSVLKQYHTKNQLYNFDDSSYLPALKDDYDKGGSFDIKIGKDHDYSCYEEFAFRRHSVRLYDEVSEVIENDEIVNCVRIAQTAPNACNRQAVRVHVTKNKDLFKRFEEIQLGCKGFACNAGAILIITADLQLYESSEIRLPSIDAGIFLMNLVNICFDSKIYTCILNGAFPGEANNHIRNMFRIPENEDIEACLLLYKITEEIDIKVPKSERIDAREICSFAE